MHLESIIVLSHISRNKEGKVLRTLIQKQSAPLGIETRISFDEGGLGIWGNYRQALKMERLQESGWRLIIHDDVLCPREAIKKIEFILEKAPENPIGFYNPNQKVYVEALAMRRHILKTHTNFWTQAFAFPVSMIDLFLQWNEEYANPEYPWEDRRIVGFLTHYSIPAYIVIPSLFQHLGAFRSSVGNTGRIGKKYFRYSGTFMPDANMYSIDWIKEFNNPCTSETKNIDKDKMSKSGKGKSDV